MASKTIKVSMQITGIQQMNAASRELTVSFTNGVSKKDDKNKIEKYQYSYWYRKGYTKKDQWIAQGSNIDVPAKNGSNFTTSFRFTPPEGAVQVKVQMRAVSKSYKEDKKTKYYFGGGDGITGWCSAFAFKYDHPVEKIAGIGAPQAPTVNVDDNCRATVTVKIPQSYITYEVDQGYKMSPPETYEPIYAKQYVDYLEIEYRDLVNAQSRFSVMFSGKISDTQRQSGEFVTYMNVPLGSKLQYRVKAHTGGIGDRPGNMVNWQQVDPLPEWSEWSATSYAPLPPCNITKVEAYREDSVKVTHNVITGAKGYRIEYTEDPNAFNPNVGGAAIQYKDFTEYNDGSVSQHIVTGLSLGKTYYFRAYTIGEAQNGTRLSKATAQKVCLGLGKKPDIPSISSSTTKAFAQDSVTLHWIHNTTDGSEQTKAEIETEFVSDSGVKISSEKFTVNGKGDSQIIVFPNNKTGKYKWRVRTLGIVFNNNEANSWSSWSAWREIQVYIKPTIDVNLSGFTRIGSSDVNHVYPADLYKMYSPDECHEKIPYMFTAFPLDIKKVSVSISSYEVLSYHVCVTSYCTYEDCNVMGNKTIVTAGEVIYEDDVPSYNYRNDIMYKAGDYSTDIKILPTDIPLANNQAYSITISADLANGLPCSCEFGILTKLNDYNNYEVDADVIYYDNKLCSYINPQLRLLHPEQLDEDGDPTYEYVDIASMNIYRKEADGSFTLIADDVLPNSYIVDSHPNLKDNSYRLTYTLDSTGKMGYYDTATYDFEENAIVVQWQEEFDHSSENVVFNTYTFEEMDDDNTIYFSEDYAPTKCKMVRLPYNISMNVNYDKDVNHVKYYGRNNPVSYIGTQNGQTETWSVDIDKKDKETLNLIRELAIYKGNVYVREPSGTGYYAEIKVSFTRSYNSMVIPVTLNITRVDVNVDEIIYKYSNYLYNLRKPASTYNKQTTTKNYTQVTVNKPVNNSPANKSTLPVVGQPVKPKQYKYYDPVESANGKIIKQVALK